MFYHIERKPEQNKEISSRLFRELQENFTRQFNISVNESNFQRFMQEAFEVVRIGNKPDWSILTGLSFSMTTLSTVGKWLKVACGYLLEQTVLFLCSKFGQVNVNRFL